jgi:hypothetical protein
MAFTALFLRLPIYAEVNPPWDPDSTFDDDEPNNEPPDLEISFPPAFFQDPQGPHLEVSVRKSQIPRVADRRKFDIESVMLQYLGQQRSPALAFVSDTFIASPKQSCSFVRNQLIETRRISRVTEMAENILGETMMARFLIELDTSEGSNESVLMSWADNSQQFTGVDLRLEAARERAQAATIEEINAAGNTLKPSRYIAKNAVGGTGLANFFSNTRIIPKYRLADLFMVVRPKTTRDDPTGQLSINEIRAGDISELGEALNASRKIAVRTSMETNLSDQVIRAGDILFAHRGPIGRVAYIRDTDLNPLRDTYAAQSVLIIRKRARTASAAKQPYCDPKVLFMYLLTAKVRNFWSQIAIGDRSPAIPIGEIERFGIPEKLLLEKRPLKASIEAPIGETDTYPYLVLREFEKRQKHLQAIRDFEEEMAQGLEVVWEKAWER